jgi:hypothetical protein
MRRHRRGRVLAVAILTDTFVVPVQATLGCGRREQKRPLSNEVSRRFLGLESGVNLKRYALELAPAPLGSFDSERSPSGGGSSMLWA